MKTPLLPVALALLALPACAQDTVVSDDGTIYDVLPYEEAGETYGVPLAPGEEILEIYAAPAVVQMPTEPDIVYETAPYRPSEDIDRVTGLPRNTAGWTGTFEAPAGIGCFPQGVCADLNN